VAETVTGTIIESEDDAFVFQTEAGERVVFRLDEASGVEPHHLAGIVGSPVLVQVTIEGPHHDAWATYLAPTHQPHP
jgi:hypothetical protein